MKRVMIKQTNGFIHLTGGLGKLNRIVRLISKGWKQRLAVLLALTLIIGICPNLSSPVKVVKAADSGERKAINLGAAVINNPQSPGTSTDAEWTGDYIYYGNYYQTNGQTKEPVKWRVLDNGASYNTSNNSSQQDCILLLSDKILDEMKFNDINASNLWNTSNLNKWLNSDPDTEYGNGSYTARGFLNSAFTDTEKGAIAESQSSEISGFNYIDQEIGGVKLFCLAVGDIFNTSYGFSSSYQGITNLLKITPYANAKQDYNQNNNDYGMWWTRSRINDQIGVNIILNQSSYGYTIYNNQEGVSPACNLDRSSILFTSSAIGGKTLNVNDVITSVGNTASSDWKLTLKDTVNQHVTIGRPSQAGSSLTIPYTNASYGDNQYISAIITDVSGTTLTRYGKLKRIVNKTDATGTLTLTLPSTFNASDMKVKLFSEQDNGDFKTDYASEPEELKLNYSNLTPITSAAVLDITEPATFNTPDIEGSVPTDANNFIVDNKITWQKGSEEVVGAYQADNVYSVTLKLAAKNGFTFSNGGQGPSVTINNKPMTVDNIDANGIATVSYTFPMTVKITPSIDTWPKASDITYGQKISDSVINSSAAHASTEGSYEWVNGQTELNAGEGLADIRFIPVDTVNYNTVEHQIPLTVSRAEVAITLSTSKTDATKVGDVVTLTATMTSQYGGSVDGTVTFKSNGTEIVSGSALAVSGSAVSVVNNQASITFATNTADTMLSAQYSGSLNYVGYSVSMDFDILKLNQNNLHLATIDDKTYGDDSFSITSLVSGGSGAGSLSYNSSNSGVATINSNGIVTINGAGTTNITVIKGSDSTYNQIMSNVVSFTVKKAANPFIIDCLSAAYPKTVLPSVSSYPKEDASITYLYNDSCGPIDSFSSTVPIKSGTYNVKAVASETKNYLKTESNTVNFTYSRKTYTVKYHWGDGFGTSDVIVLEGEKATFPEHTGVLGPNFLGWYQEPEFINTFDFNQAIYADTNIYASFFTSSEEKSKFEPPVLTISGYWNETTNTITKSIAENTPTVITVDTNQLGTAVVPAATFTAMAGHNLRMIISGQLGYTWNIMGNSIPGNWIPIDINFRISDASSLVPTNGLSRLAGKNPHTEFQIAQDGPFGFNALLSVPLPNAQPGQFASLYRFDPDHNEFEFAACAKVGGDCKADYTMNHASIYTVIVSDQPVIDDHILQQTSINVTKKTLYLKDKKTRLSVALPNSIQQMVSKGYIKVNTVYESSNKKVAVVATDGTIIPKAKGTTVIKTKVTIGDKSITFQTNIKVNKAKK